MPLACDLSPSHAVPPGLPQLPGDTGASDGGRHTPRKPPCHVCRVPSVTANPGQDEAGAVTRRDKYATNVRRGAGLLGTATSPAAQMWDKPPTDAAVVLVRTSCGRAQAGQVGLLLGQRLQPGNRHTGPQQDPLPVPRSWCGPTGDPSLVTSAAMQTTHPSYLPAVSIPFWN